MSLDLILILIEPYWNESEFPIVISTHSSSPLVILEQD